MRTRFGFACLALALLPGAVRATCGGGGGGGGGGAASNPYKATWSKWEQALKRGGPILLYYQTKPSEHPTLCCTKAAQELSKQYAFVKIPYAKSPKDLSPPDQELVKVYAFDRKPAILVMTDRHGNELSRVGAGLTEPKLTPLFAQAEKDAKALEDRLAKQLEKARAHEAKGNLEKAADGYREILKHKGISQVGEAGEAMKALLGKLTAPEADPVQGLKTLKGWQKDFKGTVLEEPIEHAIQDLDKRLPAP